MSPPLPPPFAAPSPDRERDVARPAQPGGKGEDGKSVWNIL
ncbi:hypothetical protein BW41_02689 [Sphingomonas sp. RIT328]|nr:hypothetical protein BW41_02689 [Sphingomonas sp. RIT328]